MIWRSAFERAILDCQKLWESTGSVDACIQRYPQYEREIREYFALIEALAAQTPPDPDAVAAGSGRRQLLTAVAQPRRPGRAHRWKLALAAALILFGAAVGLAAAAGLTNPISDIEDLLDRIGLARAESIPVEPERNVSSSATEPANPAVPATESSPSCRMSAASASSFESCVYMPLSTPPGAASESPSLAPNRPSLVPGATLPTQPASSAPPAIDSAPSLTRVDTPSQQPEPAPPSQGGTPPGQAGTPPGQSGTSPGQGGTPPGQAGTPPGQSGTSPGQGGTAPGQGGTPPGQGGTPPGQSGTPPGQGGTPPGQSGKAPPH